MQSLRELRTRSRVSCAIWRTSCRSARRDRTLGSMGAGAAQHDSHSGQNLAELIVKFAGDVAQGGLLRGDQFLSQFAAALGKFGRCG